MTFRFFLGLLFGQSLELSPLHWWRIVYFVLQIYEKLSFAQNFASKKCHAHSFFAKRGQSLS